MPNDLVTEQMRHDVNGRRTKLEWLADTLKRYDKDLHKILGD